MRSGSPVYGQVQDILRVDPVDGISRFDPVGASAVLGSKFTIDNIILARTTATEAFPAIEPFSIWTPTGVPVLSSSR